MSRLNLPLLYLSCLLVPALMTVNAGPETLGWLESSYLQPWGVRVTTKLDTGARTSSIHAENIELFTKGDEDWVRFVLPIGKKEGYKKGIKVERPLVREALIKEHAGDSTQRYVVSMDICISGNTYTTQFSLTDRSGFNYPIILGRLTLQGNIIVDPAKKFTGKKTCPHKPRKTAREEKSAP